jgi:hypothetical protein
MPCLSQVRETKWISLASVREALVLPDAGGDVAHGLPDRNHYLRIREDTQQTAAFGLTDLM